MVVIEDRCNGVVEYWGDAAGYRVHNANLRKTSPVFFAKGFEDSASLVELQVTGARSPTKHVCGPSQNTLPWYTIP